MAINDIVKRVSSHVSFREQLRKELNSLLVDAKSRHAEVNKKIQELNREDTRKEKEVKDLIDSLSRDGLSAKVLAALDKARVSMEESKNSEKKKELLQQNSDIQYELSSIEDSIKQL